ncbi:MAG: indoleamine 2,3-dioxygenase [Actinomycetota bacterium]
MGHLQLSDYLMSAERGYLSHFDPDTVELPPLLGPAREAALALPHTIPTGRVRSLLGRLPRVDLTEFCADAPLEQRRIAMVHYSFMVQAYVWGEPEPPASLPSTLAVPIWQIAASIGQPPLLPYSSYVLDNWGRIDAAGPIDLANVFMIQPFLGGVDEAWFVLVHVAIEARAGRMMAAVPSLVEAAADHDSASLERQLERVARDWDAVNAIFDRMPERCDPYVYFHRVRPWIHGWKDNPALRGGLVYDGVTEAGPTPQAFRGQTGSQSSIVPAMDAALGIGHAEDPLRSFLDELHHYRPPQHRRFIDDVRAASTVREVAGAGDSGMRERYNLCVRGLARFRTRHLEYAARYINKQSRAGAGNDPDVGTGGTPFMRYLRKHRDEAERHLL